MVRTTHAIAVDDIEVTVTRDNSQERQGTYRLTAAITLTGALSEAERDTLLGVAAKCPIHKLMTGVTTEIATVWAS